MQEQENLWRHVCQSICYGFTPERKSSLCRESQISFLRDKCKHLVAVLGLSVDHPVRGSKLLLLGDYMASLNACGNAVKLLGIYLNIYFLHRTLPV